jgi:hypothetical protein
VSTRQGPIAKDNLTSEMDSRSSYDSVNSKYKGAAFPFFSDQEVSVLIDYCSDPVLNCMVGYVSGIWTRSRLGHRGDRAEARSLA